MAAKAKTKQKKPSFKEGYQEIKPSAIKGFIFERKEVEGPALDQLAENMKSQGTIEPIRVQLSSDNTLRGVVGYRRWMAAKKAGIKKIPVIIEKISDNKAIDKIFSENEHRESMTLVEQAELLKMKQNSEGLNQKQLAERLNISKGRVSHILSVLKEPEEIKEKMAEKGTSERQYREIKKAKTPEKKKELLESEKTAKETEKAAKKQAELEKLEKKQAELEKLEEKAEKDKKKFQRYKDSQKKTENRIKQVNKELEKTNNISGSEEAQRLYDQITKAQVAETKLKEELENIKADISKNEAIVKKKGEKKSEILTFREEQEKELEKAEKQVKDLEKKLKKARKRRDIAKENIKDSDKQIREIEKAKKDIEKGKQAKQETEEKIAKKQKEAKEKEKKLKANYKINQNQYKQNREQRKKLVKEKNELVTQKSTLTRRMTAIEEREKELEQKREEVQKLEQEIGE